MPISEKSQEFPSAPRRFILIGGFLGAGKTTSMLAFARFLEGRGLRCGLITNDQGEGLVDSALAGAGGAATREITGGCFCCRADALAEALGELEAAAQPDVFLAEPVGSCTDLVATVLLPLKEIYGAPLEVAPMSVLLDAGRLWEQQFGRARGKGFSKDVRYIYEKQLEEAEVIVINKIELLPEARAEKLVGRIAAAYPGRKVLAVSVATGLGMEAWFSALLGGVSAPTSVMEVDYARYGVGEALLGWFNGRLRVAGRIGEIDANGLVLELVAAVQDRLEAEGVEIAHLKASFGAEGGLAVANAVRSGVPASLSRRMDAEAVAEGELLVNVRAEAAPERIEEAVEAGLASLGAKVAVEWLERAAFRPGQPNPTYRATAV